MINANQDHLFQKHKKIISFPDVFVLTAITIQTIWAVVQSALFKIDMAGRVPLTMLTLSFLLIPLLYKREVKKVAWPIFIMGIWAIYSVLNALRFPWISDATHTYEYRLVWLIGRWFYCSLIMIMLLKFNRITTKLLSLSLLLICFIYNILGSWHMMYDKFNRLYSTFINANEFAYVALGLVALQIYSLQRRYWHPFWSYTIIVYSTILLIQTGCRSAFVALLPLLFVPIWDRLRRKMSPAKAIVMSTLLLALFAPIAAWFMQDAVVVQRIQNMDAEMQMVSGNNELINMLLGERAFYYYEGLRIWRLAPAMGIGAFNFIRYNDINTVCHIEYMAQLSEGGLVGAGLYLLLLLTVVYRWMRMKDSEEHTALKMTSFVFLSALLIFNIGLFTSNQNPFYILLAYTCVWMYRPRESLD